MAGIGAAIKGIGKVLSKFKKPKSKYIGTDKRKSPKFKKFVESSVTIKDGKLKLKPKK